MAFEDGFEFLCGPACEEGLRRLGRTPRPASTHPPARIDRRRQDPAAAAVAKPRRAPLPATRPRAGVPSEEAPGLPWLGLAACLVGFVFAFVPGHLAFPMVSATATSIAAILALRSSVPAWKGVGALPWSVGPVGAVLAAIAGVIDRMADPDAWLGLSGAALASAAALLRVVLDAHSRLPVVDMANELLAGLPRRVRIPVRDPNQVQVDDQEVPTDRIRAGEEVIAHDGEVLGVDGMIKAGEADVLLFPSARTPVRRGPGEPLLAGARVTDGAVRVLATRVGDDRALARPGRFGVGTGPTAARVARLAEQASRWGGFAALVVAIGGVAIAGAPGIAAPLAAAAAVLVSAPLLAARRAADAPLVAAAAAAAERGIIFPSARLLENAGRVTIAALSSHGTVTEGDPEVVDVHAIDDSVDTRTLLALAAAAQMAAEGSTIAAAIREYAELHGIAPESVRRATFLPGRGVTALSPGGEPFVIGNRQLLLDEGVSVAIADAEAARAEARGHTVLFVGLGGRVRSIISLQDPIRPGARAAVQRVFDLHVEAVLISGDHRGTAEALARNLDVSHVKAELLPEERGAEVRRLRESGSLVAAVGRPQLDEAALAAADVPIVLSAAGGSTSENAIAIATDDVRDATNALWIAKAGRSEAIRGVAISLVGGAVLVVACAIGFVPPGVAALLGLLIDGLTLPAGARLLRRIEVRLANRP